MEGSVGENTTCAESPVTKNSLDRVVLLSLINTLTLPVFVNLVIVKLYPAAIFTPKGISL